jgi:hypothetical protein
MVFVPLGDAAGPGLVRDLYDLDSWLRNAGTGMSSLPESRKKFWDILLGKESLGSMADPGAMGGRTLYMPENIKTSTRIRTVSNTPHAALPEKLTAFTETEEQILVESIMQEVNDNYAMNMDTNPLLARSSGSDSPPNTENTHRIVIIGGSNAKRIAGGLVTANQDVIDLTRPGWVADPESIADIASKLDRYGIGNDDVVVIDMLSNSYIRGTDADENQIPPCKESGGWHVNGHLNFAPKPALKKILSAGSEKWFKYRAPKLIGLVPLPRYVLEKCCSDTNHIKNISDPDYVTDMEHGMEMLEDLMIGWVQGINERSEVFNFRSCTDNPEDQLPDLQINGRPIWRCDDPVHAVPELYREAAATITAAIEGGSDGDGYSGQGPAKRPRLESVVVRRAGESGQARGRPAPASWSTGTLPPPRGRGGITRGRPMRGRFFRGGWRGRGGKWAHAGPKKRGS